MKNWTPERYKPNFFSRNFERSFDYCQNQLISHGRIYANSSRTLLEEGNINNLRKKVYISKKKKGLKMNLSISKTMFIFHCFKWGDRQTPESTTSSG